MKKLNGIIKFFLSVYLLCPTFLHHNHCSLDPNEPTQYIPQQDPTDKNSPIQTTYEAKTDNDSDSSEEEVAS